MSFITKEPQESPDYASHSEYVTHQIEAIIRSAIESGNNRISIHTNLKNGLPLENINKIAGPFIEAWAVEQFEAVVAQNDNAYSLLQVQAGRRLELFDLVLQFKRENLSNTVITSKIDVKSTSEDIKGSGKSPNITSFARIRSEYLHDPDYIFVVLALKHRAYGDRDAVTGLTMGVMEVVGYSVFDLKYIASDDLYYNPALGTGQLQIRDIHTLKTEQRTTQQFIHLLDNKYIRSKGQEAWLKLARKFRWIEEESHELQ